MLWFVPQTNYYMKRLSLLTKIFAFFLILGFMMTSCQKDSLEALESFNIENHLGRYFFDIDYETYKDGVSVNETHNSVGYIRKVNEHTIKLLFDLRAPKVNCTYEYIVKADGSFFSAHKGVGERTGEFIDKGIQLTEEIDLGNGNYKKLDFSGFLRN